MLKFTLMKLQTILILKSGLFLASLTYAQTTSLNIGDPAPALTISQWLKGTPIKKFKEGQLYIVEFSSRGCPACVKAIPYLTDLAKEFKDKVTVLSIYVNSSDTTIPLSEYVKKLMQNMGAKMDYSVGIDVPEDETRKAWKIKGVPTAFIIDRSGIIIWKGSPFNLTSILLKEIINETFDTLSSNILDSEIEKFTIQVSLNKHEGDYHSVLRTIDSLVEIYPNRMALYHSKVSYLIKRNPEEASRYIRWLLQNDVGNLIPWINITPMVMDGLQYPDYELALETADRAISDAVTEDEIAYGWIQKIGIYTTKSSRSLTLEESIKSLEKAIKICTGALLHCKSKGVSDFYMDQLKNKKICLQYEIMILSRKNKKADKFIQELLDKNAEYIDWQSLITKISQLSSRYINYDVSIKVLDKVIKKSNNINNLVSLLQRKADWLEKTGDLEQATLTYQLLISLTQNSPNQNLINKCINNFARFREKYNIDSHLTK